MEETGQIPFLMIQDAIQKLEFGYNLK